MGLIKAAVGSVGGTFADQWKEFFYCDAIDSDVLMVKGEKRVSKRSSNRRGNDNIISNGSVIAVANGQCMMIVEQGRIVEFSAEPGEFVYDNSTEPSIFAGNFEESALKSFETMKKRFTFGGDTAKDQRVYYFNTKEILGNKFGTANPINFRVSDPELGILRTVRIRCNGTYTYKITDPIVFYTNLCGNVENEFLREEIDDELKSEFIDALMPAFGELSRMRLLPAEIPYHTKELKDAMNETLKPEWIETRGITLHKISMNPITLTPEDMKIINEMEDAMSYGGNARMMAGRMTTATANAMEGAANNPNGAMGGFVGMGMAMNVGGGMMNTAHDLYNQGQQQQAQPKPQQPQQVPTVENRPENGWTCKCGAVNSGKFCMECGSQKPVAADGWACKCGTVNKGKFCMECGSPKPKGALLYKCDKCGWEPEDPENPPKFCPECGDPFGDEDVM